MSAARLHPADVEAIAQRVAELLHTADDPLSDQEKKALPRESDGQAAAAAEARSTGACDSWRERGS